MFVAFMYQDGVLTLECSEMVLGMKALECWRGHCGRTTASRPWSYQYICSKGAGERGH